MVIESEKRALVFNHVRSEKRPVCRITYVSEDVIGIVRMRFPGISQSEALLFVRAKHCKIWCVYCFQDFENLETLLGSLVFVCFQQNVFWFATSEADEPGHIFRLFEKKCGKGLTAFLSLVHFSGDTTWRISLMTAMGSIRYVPEPFGKADLLKKSGFRSMVAATAATLLWPLLLLMLLLLLLLLGDLLALCLFDLRRLSLPCFLDLGAEATIGAADVVREVSEHLIQNAALVGIFCVWHPRANQMQVQARDQNRTP
jgi:hypothetical protein